MGAKLYKDCYVAFLDILGFKNMINDKDCNELFEIFESIKESSRTSIIINNENLKALKNIEYTIMSDSVVVYVDANLDDALFALLCTCQTIQMVLLRKGILMRGGIARGSLFREEYVIFGQGLSKAYLLESNVASLPRIIFNRELLNDGNEHNIEIPQGAWHLMLTAQDEDELYYVNPVPLGRVISLVGNSEKVVEYYENILSVCQKVLDTTYDSSIRQKYLWLKNKTIVEMRINRHIISKYDKGEEMFRKWAV